MALATPFLKLSKVTNALLVPKSDKLFIWYHSKKKCLDSPHVSRQCRWQDKIKVAKVSHFLELRFLWKKETIAIFYKLYSNNNSNNIFVKIQYLNVHMGGWMDASV